IRPANVDVADDLKGTELMLAPVVPNPAISRIAIRFILPRASDVSLSAYDVSGRKLADLADGRMQAGSHHVGWDFHGGHGREFAAGFYVIRLRVGDRVLTQNGIRVR